MKAPLVFFVLILTLPAAVLRAQDSTYVPQYDSPKGHEIVAVYISGTNCGFCYNPEFKAALEKMKLLIREQARSMGSVFSVTGVALDWDAVEGFNFLRNFGAFDEIVVGRNWFNLAAAAYIWGDDKTLPSIPQVIVFERDVQTGPAGISFGPRHVIGRYESGSIIKWIKHGAPVKAGK